MYVNRPTKLRSRAARLFIVGAVIVMVPGVVHALGLGNLRVNSALNESLNAEIDFTSISKRELKSLNVGLASRADFDSAGVEKLAYLGGIKFTLAKRLDGRSFLQLQSERPIREPFLHFLLQVEWAGGRLVREFTALIDPPYLIASKLPKIQAPQTPAPEPELVMTQPTEAVVQPLTPEPALQAETQVAELMPEPAPEAIIEAEPIEAMEPMAPVEPLVEALGPDVGDDSVAMSSEDGWPTIEEAPDVAMVESADQFVEPLPLDDMAGPTAVQPGGMMMGTGPNWANIAEYEVQRGDTLWGIAQQISIDPTLSTEQVIMALYETNPDAFFRNNVNNVYAGKILRIPERETIDRLAARDARKVFLAQYSEWLDYKVQLAQASGAIEVAEPAVEEPVMSQAEQSAEPPVETPSEPMTEEIKVAEQPVEEAMEPKAAMQPEIQEPLEPPQEEKGAASAGTAALAAKAKPPGDLLKIVRAAIKREGSEAGKVAEGEGATDTTDAEQLALAERATTLDEALESKQMEQEELSERIGTVETQIEKQKRLIEIENESLARAQGSDTQTTTTQPAEPAGAALEKKPEEVKVAAADTKATAEPAKTATAKTPDKKKPAPPKKRIVTPPPEPEQSIMAKIQDFFGGIAGDHMSKAVGGVVALAALLVGLTYFRRRRQAEAEFEESILTDTGATTEEVATTESGGQSSAAMATSSAGNTSFLSDFSQGGMGNISTDEVDPLAETEVYLAYGRDEQAEEILKEAVNKDPSRQELKVKLLEIYHARNDVAGFETMAEEVYAAQEGRGGELWNTVAEMGRKLNPDNPMFQVVAPVAEIPTEEPIPTAPPEAAFEAPEPAMDFDAPEEAPADTGLDMDADAGLDLGADDGEVDAPADTGLEFDLNMDTDVAVAADEPAVSADPAFSDTADDVASMGLEDDAGVAALDLGDAADTGVDFDISEGTDEGDLAVAEDVSAAADVATDSGDVQWD
ncbi:MAG: FimV/HubP family polar landmark protein, partial [Acidiferrobacterales bacterium]